MDAKNQTKPRAKRPPYLFVLVILTCVYLLCECAFNARLLDVVCGQAEATEIDRVEFTGRILSGLAAALAVCGSFILPWLHRRNAGWLDYSGLSLLAGLPLVLLVFYGEKILVDTLVDRSTPQERRVAALIGMASHQLKAGKLDIKGIALDEKTLVSPEGKSFISLFSPLVAHMPDAEAIIARELDSIVRQYVTQTLGGSKEFYDDKYAGSLNLLHEAYLRRYVEAVNKYREKYMDIPRQAESAWHRYVEELRRKGTTPERVPAKSHDTIRNKVRRDIPVPNSWHPADKNTFFTVYQKTAVEKLNISTDQQRTAADPAIAALPLAALTSPTPLSFEEFLQQPAIQSRWKADLNMPAQTVLKNGMSRKDFEQQAFIPLREHLIAQQKNTLLSSTGAFADGKEHAKHGRDAMRGIIVPTLALFFSLIGIIVHACKFGFYGLHMVLPFPRVAAAVNLVLFIFLMYAPMYLPNKIADTETFTRAENKISAWNRGMGLGMQWIIRAQTYLYPVNEAVKVLFTTGRMPKEALI